MVNTLNNMAMVYVKQRAWEDALEFANRSVYMDESKGNVKARCGVACCWLWSVCNVVMRTVPLHRNVRSVAMYKRGTAYGL